MTGSAAPAPRRRYSLTKLFFNIYMVAMGSFVAVAFIADFIISAALKGITEDYTERFMRGTVTLVEDELFRHPRGEWQKKIRQLDDKFAYRLMIVERNRILLPPRQAEKLDSGELATDAKGDIIYHRLRNTSQILVVGPLSPDRNPEFQRGIPLELRIQLFTWSLIGIILAVAVWFWVRPIWRDLESLRETARALGDGKFDTRAPAARNASLELLAETMNAMAERIQLLIATHKELSSAISHELRTPIARMRFAVEMLADTGDADERERLHRQMEADLDELDNLIDSSLTYARFERERPELNLAPVVLAPWLEDQVDSVRLLARTLRVEADLSELPDDLKAHLDPRSMPHAVRNLLRNAIKYANARVRLSAAIIPTALGERVRILVDDDGLGIPPEERERIFTAFTRLDRSRDRATGGYGLGLAITRQVVELHGGSVRADDSPLGGARFILEWPRHPA